MKDICAAYSKEASHIAQFPIKQPLKESKVPRDGDRVLKIRSPETVTRSPVLAFPSGSSVFDFG